MEKNNNKQNILNLLVGSLLLAVLIALNYLIDWYFTANSQSVTARQALLVLNTIIITFIALRFGKLALDLTFQYKQKPIPDLLHTLLNITIFTLAVVYIITTVFGLPIWSISAASGLIGAGVAFALQGPLLDFFTGLVLDIEKPFVVGDWIEIPHQALGKAETVGQVISRNWRTTTLMPSSGVYVTVPNHLLGKGLFVNYNRPELHFKDTLTITIDHHIPVNRAVTLLKSCLFSIPEIAQYNNFDIFASSTSVSGISYDINFTLVDYANWAKTKHKLIEKITSMLNQQNIGISQKLGVYGTYGHDQLKGFDKVSFFNTAPYVDILNALSEQELTALASKVKHLEYQEDEVIVQKGDQGDSMYIIGEGTVEVYEERASKGKTAHDFLAFLGPSEYFGDMALLTGEPRTAFIKARTPVILFEITRQDFKPLLDHRPEIAEALSQIVAERKMRTKNMIDMNKSIENKDVSSLSHQILEGIKNYFKI